MDRKITSIGIIALAVLLIGAVFFVPKEIMDQFGLFVFLIPIVIVGVVLIIAIIIVNKKSSSNLMGDQRRTLVDGLKEAEKQYLQHKIDKTTFDSISKKNNSELIKLEAEIDFQKNKQLSKADMKKADALSADKRKILFDLLEQKQKTVHELKIADGSYLKRKIDEDTYKKISSEIKTEIITIDGQIRALQETAEIDKVKDQLKESAKEIVKQKNSSKERNKLDYMDEMEEEVFEQTVGK
jgi:hypothetical protein